MAKKTESKSKLPGWLWLLTGFALAGLIMFLMMLSNLEPSQNTSNPPPITSVKTDNKKEQHFDFYQRLRDEEVPAVATKKPAGAKKPVDDSIYLLQVASFKSLSDAEQVRAELTLLNLSARIESADINPGQTWHRIVVGPFASRSKLQKARNTLLSNNYEALRIKRKLPK